MAAAMSSSSSIRSAGHLPLPLRPGLLIPDLGKRIHTHDGAGFLKSRVFPQVGGKQDPPLTVGSALHGIGVEQIQGQALRIGKLLHLFGHLFPLGLGVNGQAVLGADGDEKGVAQCFPHSRGNDQTALRINAVIRFPQQSYHGAAPFPPFLGWAGGILHLPTLIPTSPHLCYLVYGNGDRKARIFFRQITGSILQNTLISA